MSEQIASMPVGTRIPDTAIRSSGLTENATSIIATLETDRGHWVVLKADVRNSASTYYNKAKWAVERGFEFRTTAQPDGVRYLVGRAPASPVE